MSRPKILIQLDPDMHPSVFDSVVAVDAGVEHLFRHGNVTVEQVQGLVHGAIFTRGPKELHNTAIFVGGSNVAAGEAILKAVQKSFLGPLKVSVMIDSNGANTTAAAAVLAAGHACELHGNTALVLGGTGPVGQRVARLLARQGSQVRIASRRLERAQEVCQAISNVVPEASLTPVATEKESDVLEALDGVQVLMAAGAAGVQFLSAEQRKTCKSLKVAVDLNAVPPVGLEGIEVHDKGEMRDGVACFGAIGVGGTKMKIHRAAIEQLFDSNDQVLDAEEVFAIGLQL